MSFPTLPRVRRILELLALTVAAASVAGWVAFVRHDHRQSVADAERTTREMSRLVEEHVARTMEATGLVLDRMMDRVEARGLEATVNSHAAWRELAGMADALPEVGSLWLFDANGRALLGTAAFPIQPFDVSDRDYFRAHRDGGVGRHIGAATVGRVTGRRVFTLSRRIADADGSFAGIGVASIQTDYFAGFYRSLDIGRDAIIGVYRDDATIIVRHPEAPNEDVHAKALFRVHLPQAPRGTYEAVSPVDGVERVYSYRRVAGTPLVVAVALAKSEVLADWRQRSTWGGLFLLGALLVLAATVRLALRALAREDAVKRDLQRAKDELEDRVGERTRDLIASNRELGAALLERERVIDLRNRFFASVNHDLRQPFQALRLFYDMLAMRPLGPAERRIVVPMGEAVAAGEEVLSSLLDLSTLEGGAIVPQREPVEIAPLLARLAEEMRPLAAAKGLALRAVPCSGLVDTDAVLLERMLRNLLRNAIQYTEVGAILLGCRRRDGVLAIEVCDTGSGIAAEALALIFEDFYQVGNSERDRRQGLGLGLAVVRRIAGLLDHPVRVRSEVGKGTRLWIEVPVAGQLAAAA